MRLSLSSRALLLAFSLTLASCGRRRVGGGGDDDDDAADADADVDADSDGDADTDADVDGDGDADGDGDVDGDTDADSDGDGDVGTEICNGLDDDGDDRIDEGDPGGGDLCDTGLDGACAMGTTRCAGGDVECESSAEPEPESCANMGEDDDCNGWEDDVQNLGGNCDTGMDGECADGTWACEGQARVCVPPEGDLEICDNLVDDDCDGSTDEAGCEGSECGDGLTPPEVGLVGDEGATEGRWIVCRADCDDAWISAETADGGTYDMVEVCQALGYETYGDYGGTFGTVCGYGDEAGREYYEGTNACMAPEICYTVHWQCTR